MFRSVGLHCLVRNRHRASTCRHDHVHLREHFRFELAVRCVLYFDPDAKRSAKWVDRVTLPHDSAAERDAWIRTNAEPSRLTNPDPRQVSLVDFRLCYYPREVRDMDQAL